MNILFIGYWSFNDGLSLSTIKPHLKVLSGFEKVTKIYYVSFERTKAPLPFDWNIPKVIHLPVLSPPLPFFLDKIIELWKVPHLLGKLVNEKGIDLIMCRSSMAGIYGYKLWKKFQIPYTVESFEPHADYMRVSGVWKKGSIRYRLQKYFEEKQKQTARYILPLTHAYKNKLMGEGGEEERLLVLPCTVDVDKYKFSIESRRDIREKLGLNNNRKVGIYVGKKGGIYYQEEIFTLFKSIYESSSDIFFLILTPQDTQSWEMKFKRVGIPEKNFVVLFVPHERVPDYLSAADFAFNFHRSSEVSLAFSPIKNREYWANGLPIVMGENIGDDSQSIIEYGIGLIVDFEKKYFDISMVPKLSFPNRMGKINNYSIRQVYMNLFDNIK